MRCFKMLLSPSLRAHFFRPCTLISICRTYWHRSGYKPRNIEPGSYPFPRKQVPLKGLQSFYDRLKELHPEPERKRSLEPVNIGYALNVPKQAMHAKRHRKSELESLARRRVLKVPIDQVHSSTEDSEAPLRRFSAAKHYGIFNDLFGAPHMFYPVAPLNVYYPLSRKLDSVLPVQYGNLISAEHAMAEPLIDLSSLPKEHLWTLVMTSPDEPLAAQGSKPPSEYLHWMICNISSELLDGAPSSGDLLVDYSPPLPYQGTGYHRYVFVLYCQECGRIDLTHESRRPLCGNPLEERAFSTAAFYRSHQDKLTPAGLAFFQSSWDPCVRNYFREHLTDTAEPIFEIEWPSPLPPPQSRFPLSNSWHHSRRHPHGLPLARSRLGVHEDCSFDVYLDRYRDRRDLAKETVEMRLAAEGNPLDPKAPTRQQLEFPLAVPIDRDMPSWWREQEKLRRLRKGRFIELEGHDD